MNALTLHQTSAGGNTLTMSSLEIAELTGKEHSHVMRDIRSMLVELYGEGGLSKFGSSYINSQNKEQPCFDLPKRETLILISGYRIDIRAKIIDRWQELEGVMVKATSAPKLAPVFRDFMAIGKMIGLVGAQQVISANRATAKVTGINALEILDATKLIEPSKEVSYPVRDIAARMGVKSSQAMNKILEAAGFQTCHPNESPRWEPTKEGMQFAELITVDPVHGLGKPQRMWQWKLGIIDAVQQGESQGNA